MWDKMFFDFVFLGISIHVWAAIMGGSILSAFYAHDKTIHAYIINFIAGIIIASNGYIPLVKLLMLDGDYNSFVALLLAATGSDILKMFLFILRHPLDFVKIIFESIKIGIKK